MKCLFILRDMRTQKPITELPVQQNGEPAPAAWETKSEAKKMRDFLNTALKAWVCVSYGPDHRLWNSEDTAQQRRRRNLKKRSHRSQANMGKPQPAKRAEKARRLIEKRSNA